MSIILEIVNENLDYYENQLQYLKGCTITIYDFCLLYEDELEKIQLIHYKKQLNKIINVLEILTTKK